MYSPPFHSHQGSSTSPIMEVGNEVVEQELEVESNADESFAFGSYGCCLVWN